MVRRALAGIVVVAALALPASAMGATLHVAKGGVNTGNNCLNAGLPCLTVQHAVDEASAGDTIDIASGVFEENVAADIPLTFEGVGPGTLESLVGSTTIRGTEPTGIDDGIAMALSAGGTVRGLRAEGGDGEDAGGIGFAGAGADAIEFITGAQPASLKIEDVIAIGGDAGSGTLPVPSGYALEVKSEPGAATLEVEDSTMAPGAAQLGATAFFASSTLTKATITRSGLLTAVPTLLGANVSVSGAEVVLDQVTSTGSFLGAQVVAGSLDVRRSRIEALQAIRVTPTSPFGADAAVTDSLLVAIENEFSNEPAAAIKSQEGYAATLKIDGSTVVGHGAGVVKAERISAGTNVVVGLRNTAVRHIVTSGPGPIDLIADGAIITAANSSFTESLATGGGTVTAPGSGSNVAGDPGFVNPGTGDFALQPSSPLIDRGDSSIVVPGQLDLPGSPRSLDGNGDCAAAPDIGAFELTGHEGSCLADAPPTVSGFRVTNKAFAPKGKSRKGKRRRARAGASAKGKRRRVKRGTTFVYRLSEPARVTITIERKSRGRKVRRKGRVRCVQPRRGKAKPRCVRFVKVGALSAQKKAGRQTTPFSGRLRGKALRPGRYRATIVATDSAGQKSQPRRVSFRVVRG